MTLLEQLNKYYKSGNISFTMPGHKNGRGISEPLKGNFFGMDVTELEETENMHTPGEVLKNTLLKTAKFYHADESFILVNGSSSGIFTMLMSCAKRGDKIITNRGCHVSVINACIVLGLTPIFLMEKIIDRLNVPAPADCEGIEKLLKENNAAAVIITSPTYYGFEANIKRIAEAVHKYNIPLLVDEAHGAHFAANPEIFPKSAIISGADMSVQSAHKTLNAGNQTAFLHVKKGIVNIERVRKCFSIFQTTSPSYPLMASADSARIELEEKGKNEWERVHERCMELRRNLGGLVISPDRTWRSDDTFYDIDECKLVLNVSEYGMTGYEISKILREKYKIDVEMADAFQIVLIPTPSNRDEDYEILERALTEILRNREKKESKFDIKMPYNSKTVLFPSEAFYSESKYVDLECSAGLVSKNSVIPYPPGIAVLVSGEYITQEIIDYINFLLLNGMKVIGINDKKIEVLI